MAFNLSEHLRRKHGVTPQPRMTGVLAIALALAVALTLSAIPAPVTGNRPFQGERMERGGANHHQVIQVGLTRRIKTISASSVQARAGDTIEVDAGEYVGDVAVWNKDNVTLRAVGGRVRLIANGAAAEGKGIWVIRAAAFSVEGFDFVGAKVADRNGAGIRFEQGSLLVRNCSFLHNETGVLTSNNQRAELTIENSEFGHNGAGDGQSHNLYVGAIARLTVSGSYIHHGFAGHLLKSRAAVNDIRNNRLTDEAGGRASYEMEFPVGGIAYVVGNIVQQGPGTENRHMISFGAEGYQWSRNELYLVNNTLVDGLPLGGRFLRVKPGADVLQAINNLLIGPDKLESAGPGYYRNNFSAETRDLGAVEVGDYRLKHSSRLIGRAIRVGVVNGHALMPVAEYIHPRSTRRLADVPRRHPGALQSVQ